MVICIEERIKSVNASIVFDKMEGRDNATGKMFHKGMLNLMAIFPFERINDILRCIDPNSTRFFIIAEGNVYNHCLMKFLMVYFAYYDTNGTFYVRKYLLLTCLIHSLIISKEGGLLNLKRVVRVLC